VGDPTGGTGDPTGPAADAPALTPERWRAVKAVVQAALERPAPERPRFVAEACAGDPALRAEVESLLAEPDTGELPVDFLAPVAAAVLAAAGAADPAGPSAGDDAGFAAALAGRYALERVIARGAAATVYLARDLRHGRAVALKAFTPGLSAALGVERFRREIAVTAALQHPHILPLFDSGEAAGRLYYVTPYVEGETLRARLAREGALPPAEAVRLARQIADALAHAHARGVVHRDVKPENVLLRDGHVLVADFGIALAAEQDFEQAPGSAGGARLTRTGLLLGTPRYMAPEQATGDRAVDARADVYGLGAVLYEALAGEPPFAGPTAQAVVRRVLGEAPRPLAARAPAVPPGVEVAVMTALAKAPADRFPSAAAFAAALESALDRGSAGPLPTPAVDPYATRSATHVAPPVSRRRGLPAGAVALLTAGALGTGALLGWTAHAVANRTQEIVAAPARDVVRVPGTAPADAAPGVEPPAGPANDGGDGALRLVVVDRGGQVVRELPAERPWTPRFSPDGGRVAYGAFRPGGDGSELWVADLRTGAAARLTDDGRDGNDPQWSPDGRRLAYSAAADGGKDVVVRAVDAPGGADALAARGGDQFPTDWLPDGSAVLLTEQAGGGLDVLVQPAGGGAARPYAATKARESAARASADGRWVAYTSDETGRNEVYVDAYPTPGRRARVSAAGGEHPVWARDGRTLYYWEGPRLVAARVEPGAGDGPRRVGAREVLFRAPYAGGVIAMYDVSPDGQRVVLVTGGGR